MKTPRLLCIIPARSGSKRIPGKNVKAFLGKPLISYAIEQARSLPYVDRTIVDTDSEEIAAIARAHGAEVPFLRPARLAGDKSNIADATIHLLDRLKKDEGYEATHVLLLQPTSPLRDASDIDRCWEKMRSGRENAVVTLAPTHPRLYTIERGRIVLANRTSSKSSNVQQWKPAYVLNGCFAYILKTSTLRKTRTFVPKGALAVVCPRWRSVDLDTPEDWVIAETIARNRVHIEQELAQYKV